ncbi:MAG: aminopeptidase P family protein [Thermodesulfobacteriota bacterium]
MTSRLQTLRRRLARRRLDAILISQPENRRFLSNFSAPDHGIQESSGLLLIPRRGEPMLLTDSRYQIQAEQEAEGFQVILYPKGVVALLSDLLPRLGIKRLAFESHYTLHSFGLKLAEMGQKKKCELVPITDLIESMRICKEEEEVAALEESVLLNERVFQEILPQMQPGMSEIEVAMLLENRMRQLGAEGPSFATIVASGENGALPHAVPGQRRLREGEPIVIDMGLIAAGYCSDMTRTVVLGQPAPKTREIIRIVRQAQLAALAGLKPGRTGRQVDQLAREIIADAGYGSAFGHGLGHGVGLAVHEAPSLSPRYNKVLRAGMVVTVEPGIYLEGWGGVRLESMVLVTEDGCRLLNRDTSFLDL